ncbi:Putative peptidoglycan-binding domain 1 protein [Mesorhizobium loti]|nr:Putative peptidoglycan-binding domain 1 protein [Mesorhizobium loti]
MSAADDAEQAISLALSQIDDRLAQKPSSDEEKKLLDAKQALALQLAEVADGSLTEGAKVVAAAAAKLQQVVATAGSIPLADYWENLKDALRGIGLAPTSTPLPVESGSATADQIADAMKKIAAIESGTPPPSAAAQLAMDAAYQDLASAFRLIAQDNSGDAASAVRSAVEQLQAAIDSGGANSDAIQQIRGTLGVAGKPLDASGAQLAPNNVPPAPNSPRPAASVGRVDVTQPNRDLTLLHPMMRDRAQKVLAACTQQQLPFRIFEAWRAPERQQYLYEQGRSRPGRVVTYAQPWESYHQYGLAADFVLYYDGQANPWSWDDSGARKSLWDSLHQIGRGLDLEPLGFETPHLQVAGLRIGDLENGLIPDGGDQSWRSNFEAAANRWVGSPPAPNLGSPIVATNQARPPLSSPHLDWASCPTVGASDWHSQFGGQQWRFDQNGVYLSSSSAPIRSPGAPITVQDILATYGSQICKSSIEHGVPPELIVMTIGAEAGIYRNVDFTGPRTFRWEPAVLVTDVSPQTYGDYSAGPMQTLATTAREIIQRLGLSYQPMQIAPYYAQQPNPAPASNPLYDGTVNIDIGTAEIRSRLRTSGFDPVLVAACFNAGGLYATNANDWHLRTYGDHINRAVQWFGDACFVLSSLRTAT